MRKSYLKGFLLTLMLGPIGLFYSNVPLALAFTILMVLTGAISIGFVVLFWPLSLVAGIFAVKKSNAEAKEKIKSVAKKPRPQEGVDPKKVVKGLADFRLPSSTLAKKSRQRRAKGQARWIKPGESVNVGEFSIQGGFFYFGDQLTDMARFTADSDASLVNPNLDIDFKYPNYAGYQMDYWPSYSRISPNCRAAYIEWLASDRSDPETYIGYVFLYFYGIERRLLVDDAKGVVSDNERKALIRELKRLRSIYGDKLSFRSYVTDLLSHVWILNHKSLGPIPDFDLLVARNGFTSAFKFRLANIVQNGEPVDAELALAWVRSHPEYTLRTPARRCPDEFNALFKMRYWSKFGDGLKVTPTKTRLQLDYQPASPSLIEYYTFRPELPDVSRFRGPFNVLVSLAESCTSELAQFSRFVGRPGNSHDSLLAFSFLPNDLAAKVSNPRLEKFRSWIKTQVDGPSALVSVKSILDHFGKGAPSKINKREAEMLSKIAEKAGYGVAPDIRFHNAKPEINGKIVLFHGGHGDSFSPSQEFIKVSTMLRLGSLVAAADDHISDTEVKALRDVIFQESRLSETERRSLDAYLLWRLNTPANMSGLKSRLDALGTGEKVAISHILVSVVLADGKIDPSEVRQLEKLYMRLGLDKGSVASDIHKLSSSRIQRSDKAAILSSTPATQPASSLALDRDLVRLLEAETKEAQSVLESIFAEDDLDEEPEIKTPTVSPPRNGSIEGLDSPFQELYGKLVTKADWTNEELEELCNELHLLPAGAVETINDWAFDRVGALLIEDGATLFVDLDLAEEISTLQTQEPMA